MLQEHLAWYKDIFQYVYSHLFPEVYTSSVKGGLGLERNFHILLKTYRDKQTMRQQSLEKNQANYENEQPKKTHENEQKPIKIFNEFSHREEQEVKVCEKYPVLNRDNLTIPIQMILSEKHKMFLSIFCWIFEIYLKFWTFLEKRWPS